jgi:hypothetical protein
VEPIYPAGKSPAASGGERSEKAPEPAEALGWFYRAQETSEPAAGPSADEKPSATADQSKPASEPAATGSAADERNADSEAPGIATVQSGTGGASEQPDRAKPGPAASADAAGSGDVLGAASPWNGEGPPDREVTIVPGVPRYHRPGCSTIRFMDEGDLEKRSLKSAAEAGCAPCEACRPDAVDPASADA